MTKPSRQGGRVQRHRSWRKGARSILMQIPDTRAPGFKAKARRQSLAVAAADQHDDVMDFLEATADSAD